MGIRTGLLISCMFLSMLSVSALNLVKDGKPVGEIIVPEDASKAEKFAADDLRRWVKEITGAEMPVFKTPTAAANTKLFIGKKLASEWKKDLDELGGTDGFAIRRKENCIYIFGDLPRGTAYGVYHLLEANTDIIWARPDENFGTVFGKTQSIELKNIDIFEKPAFQLHGWNVVAVRRHAPTGIWVFRNRGNYADQTKSPVEDELIQFYGGGHSYFSTMAPPNPKFGDTKHNYFETNPEFYGWDAMKGGRVPETFCLTNPKLPAVSAANLVEGMKKLAVPTDYLCLGMRDSWTMCQCPECQKPIRLEDGSELKMRDSDAEKDTLFHSTQYFSFMNRVAAEIKKTYPKMKILVSAYFYAAEPPACELADNILVFFCPIGGRNNRYPLLDENQTPLWRDRFIKWQKKIPGRLCFYEYYRSYGSGSADFSYGAVQSSLAPDLRSLASSGGKGVISELTPDVDKSFSNHSMQSEWDANSIDAWLLARLLWNPNQDLDRLRDYYIQRTYREAAPAMSRFYSLMQEGWDKCDNPKKGFQGRVIDTGVEKACSLALDEAEKAAKHPNSLEMIKRLKAEWNRKSASIGRISLPNVPEARNAAADFDSPLWDKAFSTDDFKIPSNWDWGAKRNPRFPTEMKMLRDESNLYIRFAASLPEASAKANFTPGVQPDTWPKGEHGEIYLENKKGKYLFAFDGNGNRYDAMGFDRRWNSGWQLNARKTGQGWDAIAVIPLADLKFKADDKDTSLSLFVIRHNDTGVGLPEESTLKGGVLGGRVKYQIIME